MTQKIEARSKTPDRGTALEYGIQLHVLGRAIIAQADERIRWHKRTAGVMEEELKTVAAADAASTPDDWQQVSRRTDLQDRVHGHLEYARFLDFVRRHIVPTKRYRLALSDMSVLEIMPKGSYR